MLIIRDPGGTTITEQGIALYHLIVLRYAVQLEAGGIKMSRRSMTAMAMRELGCKQRNVLDRLNAAIEAKKQEIRQENEEA